MGKKLYTVSEVDELRPQFKAMLRELCEYLLSLKDFMNVRNHEKEFELAGEKISFLFSGNVAFHLAVTPEPQMNAVNAVIHFGPRPYTINATVADLEKDEVAEDELEALTHNFISTVITNMARHYYFAELADIVHAHSHKNEFSDIFMLGESKIGADYHQHGFEVTLWGDDEDDVILRNEQIDMSRIVSPNTYVERCNRYLDDAFIVGLGTGLIKQNQWTAPLFS